MPSSLFYLAAHIIFTTKERRQIIKPALKGELQAYISGIINNCQGKPIIINGTRDHIHILCMLPKDMAISKFVKSIKGGSSRWIQDHFDHLFAWQKGYALFSVSKSLIERIKDYIARQEEHHHKMSFDEELKKYMVLHNIKDGGVAI